MVMRRTRHNNCCSFSLPVTIDNGDSSDNEHAADEDKTTTMEMKK
jgi:hypothetical protein